MSISDASAVPQLRFREFDGEWVATTLGEESECLDNQRVPLESGERQYRQGKYPYYGASGIIDSIDDYIFDEDLVLLAEDGANIINRSSPIAFIATGKYWVNNHAHVYRAKNSNLFLATCLENMRYEKYNTGTAQPKLNGAVCKKLRLRIPTPEEQKKIADFLGAVDEKLRLLRARHDALTNYKKGVMQKIFTQTLRFKQEARSANGATGKHNADDGSDFPDWEEKKFHEVFERVKRKNVENNSNVMTISAQQGLINQQEYFNKSVSAKDVKGYYLLKNGDFAYNKSYSKGYPMGAIKRLHRYDKGVVSTLYICFCAIDDRNASFFEQYFEYGGLISELEKIAQEGARNHGLLNLSVIEFFRDITIPFPHPDEQQKIADFLSAIDDKITAVSAQISHMQDFKKGLLQQMFV